MTIERLCGGAVMRTVNQICLSRPKIARDGGLNSVLAVLLQSVHGIKQRKQKRLERWLNRAYLQCCDKRVCQSVPVCLLVRISRKPRVRTSSNFGRVACEAVPWLSPSLATI